ncbi:MAG: hypothetical protein ACQCN6_07400, partial [Candidatus Bathyarchaeia archaeon]
PNRNAHSHNNSKPHADPWPPSHLNTPIQQSTPDATCTKTHSNPHFNPYNATTYTESSLADTPAHNSRQDGQ